MQLHWAIRALPIPGPLAEALGSVGCSGSTPRLALMILRDGYGLCPEQDTWRPCPQSCDGSCVLLTAPGSWNILSSPFEQKRDQPVTATCLMRTAMGLCPQASVWVSFWGLQKPGAATGSTPLPFLRQAEGAAGRAAGVSTTALPQVPHVLVPSHPLQAPQIGRVASSATLPRARWAFSPEVSQGRAGRTLESPRPFWLSLSGHLAPSPCPHTVKPALVAAVRTANQVAWLVLADTGLGLLSPIRKAFHL